MARTISQIYDAIITEKEQNAALSALVPNPDEAQTLLTDLTTSSKVAIWRLWFWIVAVAIWAHENIFDAHKLEVETIAAEAVTGTRRWYVDQAKRFQNGDALIWDETLLKFIYPPTSTGEKIVTNANAIEVGNQVRIKVAKSDGLGGLEPLAASEETAFRTYINRIKFAGTNISITNNVADALKLELNIYYDPLILDGTGLLISDGSTYPVLEAIEAFIQSLPFDGVFNKTAFVDSLQGVTGVIDPVVNSSQAKPSGGIYANTGDNYTADAGYMDFDEISSILTFTPVTV